MIRAIQSGWEATGRIFKLFSEVRGLHAAAYVLGASALLSSLLALMRDRLLAHTFGAGAELDLYYAAFRIPDLIFVVLGALVSVYVLIPSLSARTDEERRTYLDTIIIGFSVLAIIATGVAFAFARPALEALFPTIAAGESGVLLRSLTYILLLQPILLGYSNIVAAVTQLRHRFLLYAATPLVYNIGIILGVVVLYPYFGLAGLAWGVVLGAFLHLAIQIPSAFSERLFHFPRTFSLSSFLETVEISLPRAIALSMTQISFLGLVAFAGTLVSGSVAVFMLAFNVSAVPLAVIGASYSVAAFPTLVALANGEREKFIAQVLLAMRHILFWSLPVIALVVILRAHVVRVILGSGSFDWTDTRLTAAALALFIISLTAQSLTLLLVRAYYARGLTRVPFVIALVQTLCTLSLGVFLMRLFGDPRITDFVASLLRVEGIAGISILALPLAYSIAAIGMTVVLAVHFNYRIGSIALSARVFGEGITAAFAAGLAAYGSLYLLGTVTLTSTLGAVFLKGGVAGVVGVLAAALAYRALGSREYQETLAAIRARVWRSAEPVSSAEGNGVSRT